MELNGLRGFWLYHLGRAELIKLLNMVGQYDEAEQVLRDAVAELTVYLGKDHCYVKYACVDVAEQLISRKKYTEAESLLLAAQQVVLSNPLVPASEKRRTASLFAVCCGRAGT